MGNDLFLILYNLKGMLDTSQLIIPVNFWQGAKAINKTSVVMYTVKQILKSTFVVYLYMGIPVCIMIGT